MTLFWFVLGLAMLVYGAGWLVDGASRLATKAGVSPLVVGLTIVAFGTSAPEMAVSVSTSLVGQADMAVGNVVGSNICNVLLILGLAACITPLVVARDLVRRDVPLMVGTSLATWLIASDGVVGRGEGLLLVLALVTYTWWIVLAARREGRDAADPGTPAAPASALWRDLAMVLLGFSMLVLGSHWLVDCAVQFAQWFGVSEVVIGLTIVALGTSLPELATSAVAAMRGQRDIAIGNVVGSNLFNLLGVLGATALVTDGGLVVAPSMIAKDFPVMIAAAVACLPLFAAAREIPRWQGAAFLVIYAAHTLYLALDATGHHAAEGFGEVLAEFVVPLALIAALAIAIRVRAKRK